MKKYLLTLINIYFVSFCALAQEQLVKNINPYPDDFSGCECNELTPLNNKIVFGATDLTHGWELWITDGTTAGTVMVKDINPGPHSSIPNQFRTGINLVYFTAYTDSTGDEIWKTDGTTNGTQLVKDLPAPSSLLIVGDTLYFVIQGTDLYRTNGSDSGTILLKHFTEAIFDQPISFKGDVFFPGYDGDGFELWKTDGTPDGTVKVKDIQSGAESSSPGNFAVVDSTLFFAAYTTSKGIELYKSDGTSSGTVLVKDINNGGGFSTPHNLFGLNGVVYFEAADGTHGDELWRSDGTSSGTKLVKDLEPGSESSYIFEMQSLNDTLYLAVSNTEYGSELWKSDGTSSGTTLLKDVYPGFNGSLLNTFTVVDNKLFFWAYNQQGGELWVTDGSTSGTKVFDELGPGGHGYGIGRFGVISDDTVVIAADDAHYGFELFEFNPAVDTINLVKDIYNLEGSCFPEDFLNYNDLLFFRAYNTPDGYGVYRSDGTDTGTFRIKTVFNSYSAYTEYAPIMAGNGDVYFMVTDSPNNHLWKTDGTVNGTSQVTDDSNPLGYLNSSYTFPDYGTPTVANDLLFFSGSTSPFNIDLWRTDGTNGGTIPLTSGGSYPYSFAALHDRLYFFKQTSSALYKSDGTFGGTQQAKDLYSAGNYLVNMNDTLYFMTGDVLHGNELWKSDGTENGTSQLKDIRPGAASSNPSGITVVNCILYFAADDGIKGNELWKSDGTADGTMLVKDINPGVTPSNPSDFIFSANTIFFWANDGVNGRALWKTDGTTNGTQLVKDVFSGAGDESYYCRRMFDVNGTCYFVFADTINGRMRLYRSDGTDAGTYAVTSDSFSLSPNYDFPFMNVNGSMYVYGFDGTDTVRGELYKIANPDAVNSCYSNNISFFCSGATIDIPFSFITLADAGNIYTAELSDELGDFGNSTSIGSLTSSLASGTISCTIPPNLPDGTAYKIRVSRSSPAEVSEPVPHDFTYDDDCDGLIEECSVSFALVADSLVPHHYWLISDINAVPPISYIWSWGDGSTDTIANPSHTYASEGFYTICLSIHDSTGCSDSTCVGYDLQKSEEMNLIITVDVVDSIPDIATGITNENILQSFSVYPSPASSTVFVNYSLSSPATVKMELYDVLGNKLKEILNDVDVGEHHTVIDTRKFSNGVYYLKIKAGKQIVSQKIVVIN